MDILLALTVSSALLIFSVLKDYSVVYSLLASIAILIAVLVNRGFKIKCLINMAFLGIQRSFSVLEILLLIGAITAVWMAAGTIPALVYHGLKFINAQYFIFSAFILSSLVSTLIGSSFGTVGTIGIALMIMQRGSDINSNIIAGAIISGAYLGDRCSPMSSSAHLIASITKTDLYKNLKNMISTGFIPLIFSSFFYFILSIFNPVTITKDSFSVGIRTFFDVNPLVLIPALAILILSILRVDVKLSMLVSIMIGIAISIIFQDYSLPEILKFIFVGFTLGETTPLRDIITGGGLISMAKVSVIVMVSTAFAGIFAGTKMLEATEISLRKTKSRSDLFLLTAIISIMSAAFGCTQTIAILLTQQLVKKKYEEERLENYSLAVDLENTAVVISPLIPWNIAGVVPATLLTVGSGFIPYTFYLYLIPLLTWVHMRLSEGSFERRLSN